MRRRRKTSQTENYDERKSTGASLKIGAVALTFLVIGYQAALFVNSSAVAQLIANRDAPDTVYVSDEALARRILDAESSGRVTVRRDAQHSGDAQRIYLKQREKRVESFPFDPNTVSVADLQRLGFSEKQALSIDAYRKKGGRFRRPSDFAKSYVVADSVFSRLEPYIRIPRVDINAADSAAFDALPGIGAYYASKMVEYRRRLQGYSYPEQLMDLKNFDEERFKGLADLITVGEAEPYALWTLPPEQLAEHPYIGSRAIARSIVLFREHHRPEELSVKALAEAGILDSLAASRLERCRIAPPGNGE